MTNAGCLARLVKSLEVENVETPVESGTDTGREERFGVAGSGYGRFVVGTAFQSISVKVVRDKRC